jgi:hypothetical protein
MEDASIGSESHKHISFGRKATIFMGGTLSV